MKHTVRHGGKISCDVQGCTAIFVTYSMATLVRRQAIGAGWRQLPFVMYPEAQRKKVDACPEHAIEIAKEHAVTEIAKRVCDFEAQLVKRLTKTTKLVGTRIETISAKHGRFVKRLAKACRSITRDARRDVRQAFKDGSVFDAMEVAEDAAREQLEESIDVHREARRYVREVGAEVEVTPAPPKRGRPKKGSASLMVVLEVLREAAEPLSVQEIIERAGTRLPSQSKTPHTVVSRDLAMEIKLKGNAAVVERTAPGRFKLRETVPF